MKIWLHGFATTPEIWKAVRKPATVSSRFPSLDFSNIEREAVRVAECMGTNAVVVGWSMGGMVALKVAVMVPEKLQALILVSTTPKFIGPPVGLPPVLLNKLVKRIEKEGTKAFHDLIFKDGQRVGLAHLSVERAKAELAELAKTDLRNLLPQVRIPTLIIHGDRDEICLPAAAEYMHRNIKNSELVMLKGVGHAPMIEAPELFNSIVDQYETG